MQPLSFGARFFFAFACFFRVLFDGVFAARAKLAEAPPPPVKEKEEPKARKGEDALLFLALLQRGGRLVDFLEQDIANFSDADIGIAARVVHDGCAKALHEHAKVAPIRTEDEGASVTIPKDFDARRVKLTGALAGDGPWKGTLRHKGWAIASIDLPAPMKDNDASIVCPAEVEL